MKMKPFKHILQEFISILISLANLVSGFSRQQFPLSLTNEWSLVGKQILEVVSPLLKKISKPQRAFCLAKLKVTQDYQLADALSKKKKSLMLATIDHYICTDSNCIR